MRRTVALLLILGALTGAACSKVAKDSDTVLAAIDKTEQVARTFSYTEEAGGHRTVVTGAVHDDFRYRVDTTVDGQPAVSEVVYDDTRALKLASAGATKIVVPSNVSTSVTGAQTVNPGASLPTGAWVQDVKGASSLALTPPPTQPGKDPMADALTALEYLRFAVGQAATVQRWDPQSENYRPRLDVFPRPAAGVVRYDLVPPDLPPRQRVGTGTNIGLLNQVPGVPFFRLMAVYVQGGLIRDVREQIAVKPRLADSQSSLEQRLGDFVNGVSQSAPLDYQAAALLFAINTRLQRQGQPVVRPRSLDLQFSDLGRPQPVALPQGATQTDLSSLGTYDLLLYESK